MTFGPLFREHTFLTADISDPFCSRVTKFGTVRGLANRHLLSEFGELWPTSPGRKNFQRRIFPTSSVGEQPNVALLQDIAG